MGLLTVGQPIALEAGGPSAAVLVLEELTQDADTVLASK